MRPTALIIGITGGIGSAVAHSLLANGWHLRALHRKPALARQRLAAGEAVEWVTGDALDPASVTAAAQGVSVIFHGANPSGYRHWRQLALPMLRNAIAAAGHSGARLLFPGNLYNFAAEAGPCIREDQAQAPASRKGAIRVEMEGLLQEAAHDGVRSLVLRAGDFFGPGAESSWFSQVLVKPGRQPKRITYPGPPQVAHAWAYVPDLAATFARLAEIERELPDFEVFHFAGHYLTPGVEMAEAIRRAVGGADLPIREMPWWALRLAAPFVPLFRELLEMRYLWQHPLGLDNSKLVALLGQEPRTPLDRAVRDTLTDLGCLPGRSLPAPSGLPAMHRRQTGPALPKLARGGELG